ncbi:hypothetical protein [Candidatus Amarolinea dominans]|uniref:hypothetical protein n=1 Tax=Candidatus Amarolinea dominans TaxID=3140696 RepID=UPI0031364E3C|nr:hypothetical protein [Anaerolineae bacterium]
MVERLLDEIFQLPWRSLLVLECAKTMFADFSWADGVVVVDVEAAQDNNITERFAATVNGSAPRWVESVDVALNRRGLACVQADRGADLADFSGVVNPVLRETFS